MNYNLKNAASNDTGGDFQALPADRYALKAEEAEVKSSAKGNSMVAITFKVVGGEFNNRKLWHNFTLTEKALPFLVRFLTAVGSDIANEEDVSGEAIAQDIVGRTVSAYTTPGKTINGNPKNDLTLWKPVTDAVGTTSNSNDELFK